MSRRYLVVQRRENADWDEAYQVVDTNPGIAGRDEGRVMCSHAAYDTAHTIADALNHEPTEQLEVAHRALVDAHRKLVALDGDESASWASFHDDEAVIALVDRLQHQHEEPF